MAITDSFVVGNHRDELETDFAAAKARQDANYVGTLESLLNRALAHLNHAATALRDAELDLSDDPRELKTVGSWTKHDTGAPEVRFTFLPYPNRAPNNQPHS
jgi:hypothetical protein